MAQKETQLKEDRSGDHRDWKWVEKSGAIHLTWRGLKVSVKTQAWPEARLQGLFSGLLKLFARLTRSAWRHCHWAQSVSQAPYKNQRCSDLNELLLSSGKT